MDPNDAVKLAQKGITLPMATDPGQKLAQAFGVADPSSEVPYPATFVVDKEGFIRFLHVGESVTDRPPLESVETIVKHLSP